MLSLGSLAFAAPLLLLGLAVLPLLWWLLRITPPAPKMLRFPALQLLRGLAAREETPAKTPLWLLLLRLALAALIILGLAHPLLNPNPRLAGSGPLMLVIDNGWSAARHWDERRQTLDRLIDQAEREDRRIVLLDTAPPPGGKAAEPLAMLGAADAHAAAAKLAPLPWPVDRTAALHRLAPLGLSPTSPIVWLADGIDDGDAAGFARDLADRGTLTILTDAGSALPRLLAPADRTEVDLAAIVRRPDPRLPDTVVVRAIGEDGRLLARHTVTFEPGAATAVARLPMPSELRNQATALAIEGEASAGAVLLLDERWRRRPVGIVMPSGPAAAQPLLSGAYYLDKALAPFSEVRTGDLATLLKGDDAVLVLPDAVPASAEDRKLLSDWIAQGGTLLRFAGPRLAQAIDDDLLPVTLRRGGRTLGGALSWEKPAPLAPFAAASPFAGLTVPEDVTVSRQVLAEPTPDLGSRTWAELADGTPLVTAEKQGKGWLILVHTTADPEWSNLALSGLFVEMLRRIVAHSSGVPGHSDAALPPVETLDGFGRLQPAPATAETIAAGSFRDDLASASHPPGFYGTPDARQALNLAPAVAHFTAMTGLPPDVRRQGYAGSGETDLRPALLGLALLLALVDLAIAYVLRGLVPVPRALPRTAALLVLFLMPMIAAPAGASDDSFAIKATSEFHLAYIRTGIPEIDDEARAGLQGLSNLLNQRTSVEAAEPMEVDVERDDLIFFPLLYWPVADGQQLPSPQAIERLNHYLATGGTILFDTRDQGEATPAAETEARLKRLTAGLDLPPLVRLPPDHVLTKSFYLMQEFPGRWNGSTLWVQPTEDQVNDGVASVIVGGNDWAGAWAVDETGQPLYPVVPGGERQRELAYRFGVNLVMYALTGNYKTDQVHVPAILERLGQ